jgi:hypothetical protein
MHLRCGNLMHDSGARIPKVEHFVAPLSPRLFFAAREALNKFYLWTSIPSGAKALDVLYALTAQLKPRPFKTWA